MRNGGHAGAQVSRQHAGAGLACWEGGQAGLAAGLCESGPRKPGG